MIKLSAPSSNENYKFFYLLKTISQDRPCLVMAQKEEDSTSKKEPETKSLKNHSLF